MARWISVGAIWKKKNKKGNYIAMDPEAWAEAAQLAEPMFNGNIAVQMQKVDPDRIAPEKRDKAPIYNLSVVVDSDADQSTAEGDQGRREREQGYGGADEDDLNF